MAEDRKLLLNTAIRPTVIMVIAYAIVKCVYYAVCHWEYMAPRAAASAAAVLLTLVFLMPNLSRRHLSWIVPTGVLLAELLIIPFVGYDKHIYFLLVGCALLSFLFTDLVGLLITAGVSWAAVSIYLFVFGRSLVGGTVMGDDVFYFSGVVALGIMIVFMCKFFVGVIEESRRGAEAALDEARKAGNPLMEEYNVYDTKVMDRIMTKDADMPDKNGDEPEAPSLSEISDISAVSAPKFRAPGVKALVTDDIKTNLKVAERLLAQYDISADTCQSGAEAIEAIKNNRYDLIFMDHMMPGMDGIETIKLIRELGGGDSRFRDLPIIALTANALAGARDMFLQNGFDDFLSKPIGGDKLAAILETWIPNEKKIPVEEKNDVCDDIDSDENIVIDGVNVKLGIARTGGTVSGYLKTLEIFCGDGREKIEEINKCMIADDMQLYTTYVHALKSAAANIGAVRLSEAAKVLEAAGKRGDRVFINKHTARVMADLVLLLRNAEKVVAAQVVGVNGRYVSMNTPELRN